jgi:membrane associated rhomboid family serine protease
LSGPRFREPWDPQGLSVSNRAIRGPALARFGDMPKSVKARGVDSFVRESDDEQSDDQRIGLGHRFQVWISFRQSGAVMGIYDREYYRGETGGTGFFSGVSPVTKSIIVINAAVFLLDQLINRQNIYQQFIDTYLCASPNGVLRNFRVWQLLTAAFLHSDIWHLLGNMWFLWIVGREMESLYGSRDFLVFYLGAAILSTLAWVLITAAATSDPRAVMMGASGAVMAVVTLYTLFYPRREILLFFIPMPMWLLLVIYLFLPLLPVIAGGTTNIAVEAHLAGAAVGFLFKQFDLRCSRLFSGRVFKPRLRIFSPAPREQTRTRSPNTSRTPASVGSGGKSAQVNVLPEEQLDARLDEILAKIAREGRAGLTEEESRVLQEASRRARIRRSDRL